MALTMRVACNKEGYGNSNKGHGNKVGGQATATRAMATMWAMATAMRLADNKDGMGKGGKGNGDGNVRVVGKEEGKGSKAMAMATRMAGKWTATATRVAGKQWQWQ
jgi:hypothetical protein